MNINDFRRCVDTIICLEETPQMHSDRRELADEARVFAKYDTSRESATEIEIPPYGTAARVQAIHLAAELTNTSADVSRTEGDHAVYILSGPLQSLQLVHELYRLFDTQLTWTANTLIISGDTASFVDAMLEKWIIHTRSELTSTRKPLNNN